MRNFSFMFRSSECSAALAVLMLLGTGCLPRGTDEADLFAPAPPAYAQVNFSTLQSTVLAPHCIQCHADFDSAAAIAPYVTPGNPQASSLYTEISTGDMPPGGPPLSSASLMIVATYIDDLVQNSGEPSPTGPGPTASPSPSPSPVPPPTVDFATLESKVLAPLCLQCHSDFNTAAGIAAYVAPGDPAHSPLYEDAESGAMPPGGPAVSQDGLETISDYILGLPAAP